MGTSLHNKIYLGRHHALASRPVQLLAAAALLLLALSVFAN